MFSFMSANSSQTDLDKRVKEWKEKWETLPIFGIASDQENPITQKIITVLADYVGLTDAPKIEFPSDLSMIFSHPKRKFRREAFDAIEPHLTSNIPLTPTNYRAMFDDSESTNTAVTENKQPQDWLTNRTKITPLEILMDLKRKLGSKPIDQFGELQAIRLVIKEKTGLDFDNPPEASITSTFRG